MSENSLQETPIAVYQMGKVGSETILNSLNNLNLSVPIYHVHLLSPKNINIAIANHQRSNQPLTLQLEKSKILRDYLDREKNSPLNVISAVREPVAQYISAFFQNIEFSNPNLIDEKGNLKESEIAEYLTAKLMAYDPNTAWNSNWFDNDFKPALKVDVYQYKFDKELGYVEFGCQNVRVLILQLENSPFWNKHIASFLQLSEPIDILKRNLSYNKAYNQVYQNLLKNFRLPVKVLTRIYNSKYCNHFYSQVDIQNFINKWSTEKKQDRSFKITI